LFEDFIRAKADRGMFNQNVKNWAQGSQEFKKKLKFFFFLGNELWLLTLE
jgi:hypothetical protein